MQTRKITKETILKEIKKHFTAKLKNMYLKNIDDDYAEELLALRHYSNFENLLEELTDNNPNISDCLYKQIVTYAEDIYKSLPKNLHYEIAHCIYEDFILIATYLVADEDNRYIASMYLDYAHGNIPMLHLGKSNKSLQEVFMEFKSIKSLQEVFMEFRSEQESKKNTKQEIYFG